MVARQGAFQAWPWFPRHDAHCVLAKLTTPHRIGQCTEPTLSCQLSMNGKRTWRDNVFVERLWKSIKYEEVFLHAYETVFAAKEGINRYVNLYNVERPHSSLAKRTPNEAYAAFATTGERVCEMIPAATAKRAA